MNNKYVISQFFLNMQLRAWDKMIFFHDLFFTVMIKLLQAQEID